jgi:excisionase family DNA binding protein
MMKSKPGSRVVLVPLRASYTIAELAKLTQVTRHTTVRLLEAHPIQFLPSGRAFYVSLRAIEEKVQTLRKSTCTSGEARRRRGDDPLPSRR